MTINRRGLFGLLPAAVVAAPVIAKTMAQEVVAEPVVSFQTSAVLCRARFRRAQYEVMRDMVRDNLFAPYRIPGTVEGDFLRIVVPKA